MKFAYACTLGVVLAACSSPRYVYYFPQPASVPVSLSTTKPPALIPPPEEQVPEASADKTVTPSTQQSMTRVGNSKATISFAPEKAAVTIAQPARAVPPDAASLSDSTFRLSLIFLIGGLFIWVIGGPVFTVVGSLAMLTGVVFGIKWFFKK